MDYLGNGSGVDGALVISTNTTETVIDSACTATSGTTSISATNASFAAGQMIFIHQTWGSGAGSWEYSFIGSYSAGTITTQFALVNNYASGAQVRVVPQYAGVTIDAGVTYTAKAWNGTVGGLMVFVSTSDVNVNGTISASGKGFRGGLPSADTAPQNNAGKGESETSNDRTGNKADGSAQGMGGGGGEKGQDFPVGMFEGAGGGGGGHTSAGTNGESFHGDISPGLAGSTYGNSTLTQMVFGGGGGANGYNKGGGCGIDGGTGGGIIFITAPVIIVDAAGSIVSNGNNGQSGIVGGGAEQSYYSGSGAGAGGTIFLRGTYINIGTNRLSVKGGTGGTGERSDVDGGNGGDGQIRTEGCEVVGSTNLGYYTEAEGGHDWCQSFIHIYGTN